MRSALDIAACGAGCTVGSASLTTSVKPNDVVLNNADLTTTAMVSRVASRAGRLPTTSGVVVTPAYSALDTLSTASTIAVVAEAPPVALSIDLNTTAPGSTLPAGMAYHPLRILSALLHESKLVEAIAALRTVAKSERTCACVPGAYNMTRNRRCDPRSL